MSSAAPSVANDFLAEHVARLRVSFRQLTGCELLPEGTRSASATNDVDLARTIYHAPFVVLSHGTEADPLFNYANLAAQKLFEMQWSDIIGLPSRYSAEPVSREERARLLEAVTSKGYIDDYRGVRISSSGRRFMIEQATVWNVSNATGQPMGQAATFAEWTPV